MIEEGYQRLVRPAGHKGTNNTANHNTMRGASSPRLDDLAALNRVAQVVWELLDCAKTIDEIAGVISEEFHLPRELATREIHGFIRLFSEIDMVTVSP